MINKYIEDYLNSLPNGIYRVTDIQKSIAQIPGGYDFIESIIFDGDGRCEKEKIGNALAGLSPDYTYNHKKNCNCKTFVVRRVK